MVGEAAVILARVQQTGWESDDAGLVWCGMSAVGCVHRLHWQQRGEEAECVMRALCLLDWHHADYLQGLAQHCLLRGEPERGQKLLRLARLLEPATAQADRQSVPVC